MKNALKLLVLALLSATHVFAASVKLKGGANAEPLFTDNVLSLQANAELSGLGNGDVEITILAEADTVSTCTNQGGNQAPGQNPAPTDVQGSVGIPEDEIKNGNLAFEVETELPTPNPIPGAPGCPNENWTELIEDLKFTSATITVEQPAGTEVLVVECDIDPPSNDGVVSKAHVECTQTQLRRLRG